MSITTYNDRNGPFGTNTDPSPFTCQDVSHDNLFTPGPGAFSDKLLSGDSDEIMSYSEQMQNSILARTKVQESRIKEFCNKCKDGKTSSLCSYDKVKAAMRLEREGLQHSVLMYANEDDPSQNMRTVNSDIDTIYRGVDIADDTQYHTLDPKNTDLTHSGFNDGEAWMNVDGLYQTSTKNSDYDDMYPKDAQKINPSPLSVSNADNLEGPLSKSYATLTTTESKQFDNEFQKNVRDVEKNRFMAHYSFESY